MAWEWVGPVTTGVVGIAGTTGTILVARITSRTARDVARQSSASQREVALDERRAAAMTELLAQAARINNELFRVGHGGAEFDMNLIGDFDRAAVAATLYGNRALQKAVNAFSREGLKAYAIIDRPSDLSTNGEALTSVEEARRAIIREARKIVGGAQDSAELTEGSREQD